MATKAKKAPAAASKSAAKAAAAGQSCPAEGMEAALAPRKGHHPQVKGGPAPYLMVDGAVKAAEFYKRAFGAEEVGRHPPDAKGRTMHLHLYVNGGSLMLSDAYPEHGHPWKEPQGFNLHLQVDDVDKWWDRAIKAGAESRMPVQLMFWGDRYGQLRDPFGVVWGLATTPKPKT
jgi:PhnB protein